MTAPTPDASFRVVECQSCKAPIIWAATDRGRAMPVDAEPTPDGNVMLTPAAYGGAVASVVQGTTLFGDPLRKSHFATCPDADEWRKRGQS